MFSQCVYFFGERVEVAVVEGESVVGDEVVGGEYDVAGC